MAIFVKVGWSDFSDCPFCRGVRQVDSVNLTQEEKWFCYRCGSSERTVSGKSPTNKQHEDFSYEGFGSFLIARKNEPIIEIYDIGGLDKTLTEKDLEKFKNLFSSPEIDLERSFVATYDLERQGQTLLFG